MAELADEQVILDSCAATHRTDPASANAPALAYADSLEHIGDELERIDLLIHLNLLRQQLRTPRNPLEDFKGLVVTGEEVAQLLSEASSETVDTPEIRAILQQDEVLAARIRQRCDASAARGILLPLAELARMFSLTAFEEGCLLLALAPELNRKYGKLYSFLHDDVTRKQPSVELALSLLCPTTTLRCERRRSFDCCAPLQRYGLVHIGDSVSERLVPLISRPLKLDDRIVSYLLGDTQLDSRIAPLATLRAVDCEWGGPAVSHALQTRLRKFVEAQFEQLPETSVVFHLRGYDRCGSQYLAECVCADLGLPLLVADAAKMLDATRPIEELVWLIGREALLQPAAIALENFDTLLNNATAAQLDSVLEAAHTFTRITFLFGQQPWRTAASLETGIFIDVPLPNPDAGERRRLWESRLSEYPLVSDVDASELASKFRLSPGQMEDALAAATIGARWRCQAEPRVAIEDLRLACRAQSGRALDILARKIEPLYHWDDIVLPDEALAQLGEMCERVNQRHRVLSEWGFGRRLSLGRGVNALFAGPSGTGKTMAAEIIAGELGLDLYKIDLSGVVSKYIGETEKNLSAIFSAAENSNAILFFDEADSLFGKRSEVRDSHDRYANLEISYLLQKMEEYDGAAILATNLRQNLDESFLRRLTFTIHFPFPEEADRRRIWLGVWPPELPRAGDLDFDFLSQEYKLSGGNIKNIALAAAYLAASDGGQVTMEHLLHATRREFQKMGKVLSENGLKSPIGAQFGAN